MDRALRVIIKGIPDYEGCNGDIEGRYAAGVINNGNSRAHGAELSFNDSIVDIIWLPFCCKRNYRHKKKLVAKIIF
jgi:hypothetical protein